MALLQPTTLASPMTTLRCFGGESSRSLFDGCIEVKNSFDRADLQLITMKPVDTNPSYRRMEIVKERATVF